MANWCENHIGFNSGSLTEIAMKTSMQKVFGDEEIDIFEMNDEWVELGYGFCTPTNFENQNEDALQMIGEDDDLETLMPVGNDGEINIKNNHPNFMIILNLMMESNPTYYDENKEMISKEDFEKKIHVDFDFTMTFCEMEPP